MKNIFFFLLLSTTIIIASDIPTVSNISEKLHSEKPNADFRTFLLFLYKKLDESHQEILDSLDDINNLRKKNKTLQKIIDDQNKKITKVTDENNRLIDENNRLKRKRIKRKHNNTIQNRSKKSKYHTS